MWFDKSDFLSIVVYHTTGVGYHLGTLDFFLGGPVYYHNFLLNLGHMKSIEHSQERKKFINLKLKYKNLFSVHTQWWETYSWQLIWNPTSAEHLQQRFTISALNRKYWFWANTQRASISIVSSPFVTMGDHHVNPMKEPSNN